MKESFRCFGNIRSVAKVENLKFYSEDFKISYQNMDSDDDHDEDALSKQLSGFLFGNIDENGKLESDFLDDEAKKHVTSLSK